MEELLKGIKDKEVQKAVLLILEALKPLQDLVKNQDDEIMDVAGVAKYLSVQTSWVYKKIQYKEIPCTHLGKYPRFRRREIDVWFDQGCPDIKLQHHKRLSLV
jgi:excisionase family DNA binding protein